MKVDQGRVQFFAGGGKWICYNSVFTLVGWAGGLHEVQTYKNHPEDFLEHNLLKNPHFQRFWWRWGSGSGGWLGCNNSQGRKVFFTLFLVFHHILLFVLVIIVPWIVLIFSFSSTCFFLTENLRQGSFTQMTLMPTIDLLSHLSWCRPANILQWLEVPPVDGDRWEVIFNLRWSRTKKPGFIWESFPKCVNPPTHIWENFPK